MAAVINRIEERKRERDILTGTKRYRWCPVLCSFSVWPGPFDGWNWMREAVVWGWSKKMSLLLLNWVPLFSICTYLLRCVTVAQMARCYPPWRAKFIPTLFDSTRLFIRRGWEWARSVDRSKSQMMAAGGIRTRCSSTTRRENQKRERERESNKYKKRRTKIGYCLDESINSLSSNVIDWFTTWNREEYYIASRSHTLICV